MVVGASSQDPGLTHVEAPVAVAPEEQPNEDNESVSSANFVDPDAQRRLEKELAEIAEAMEKMKLAMEVVKKRLEDAKSGNKEHETNSLEVDQNIKKHEIEKEIKEIKGYDSRNIKRPTEWTGEKDEFTVWKVLFVAYLGTFDKIWKK